MLTKFISGSRIHCFNSASKSGRFINIFAMIPSRSELFDLSQIIATKKHERVNFAVNVLQKDILTKDATL